VSPLVLGLSRTEILPSDARGWALVIGMGLLTSLVPKIGYALAAPFVGSARAATAGAVELPTMFLIGWIAFGESLGWIEIGAALLVLAAVFLTPSRPVTWDLETKGVRRRSLVRGSR
jgi:drug/metabolite transporter (DMT)-like permease